MNTADYLDNPEKWQACSHPELSNTKPEDLFDADFAARYHRLHEDLWLRIIQVHGTLYALDQLNEFPFSYVCAPDKMEFWRLIAVNFSETVYVTLHGLFNDRGRDTHNIRLFCSEIKNARWRCQEKCELFKRTLEERGFDDEVDSIARRVGKIRTIRIAHRLIDRTTGNLKEVLEEVTLKELWHLFYAVQSLFGVLSFGSAYATLAGDWTPGTVGGQPTRTCLEDVLDAVLRDSYFVKQPELRGQWWPRDREHMNAEELQLMNSLRRRVGLPEA